jgi:hypothetical protein
MQPSAHTWRAWCGQMRRASGGRLTARDVRRFAETPDAEAAVEELVALGYWTQDGDGYTIRHHMEHQPEPDLIARRRGQEAERQRRKRRRDAGLIEGDPSRRDSLSDDTRYPGRDGSGRASNNNRRRPRKRHEI